MQISRIDVYQLDLPYSGGVYHLSHGRTYTHFDGTFVRITTDDGLEGWGESTPFGSNYIAAHALGVRAGLHELAPHLLGKDPRKLDRINDVMDHNLMGHTHVKTPIDVACWDLFGKKVGMPACDLLGGRVKMKLPLLSSIHSGTPEDMRQRVAEHRKRGYRGHSIKIGALIAEGGPALDAARIEACLADRQPGEYFLADANGGMSVEGALRLINLLPEQTDVVLEAPCTTWRESVSLKRKCRLPIIWDELAITDDNVMQMISENASDGISIKISKNGGLTHGRKQRDFCIASGYTMNIQETVGTDIAYAAILHLAQSIPERYLTCVSKTSDLVTTKVAEFDIPLIDGGVEAPMKPGLGITPNAEIFGAPVATWS